MGIMEYVAGVSIGLMFIGVVTMSVTLVGIAIALCVIALVISK